MSDRTSAAPSARLRRPLGSLAIANLAFVAANVVHGLDHARQGTDRLTSEVLVGGTMLTILAVGTLYFTLRDDARAPLLATVVGLWAALGVAASHLAPHWSAFSDPYPDLGLDALSWAVMLAELAAALAFGLIGLRAMRRRRHSHGGSAPRVADPALDV